ncbi:MAG: glycine dehydrogenase (aminomethyl-transferring), partial [Actinobacteria bacterium]|nr:glycine dehydrogenase (aminomethyl-transferring) [Actinomycetota bacterium]
MSTVPPSIADQAGRDPFESRHIGPPEHEQAHMLATIGVDSLGELIDRTVPADIRLHDVLDLPEPLGQLGAQQELKAIAERNRSNVSLIGMGYHGTVTPPVIRRNVLENPGWYTAYTPYQPEISQGRLEALLNFQTMVIELTGMEVANASLLDEPTAVAEAMTMLHRVNKARPGDRFVIDTAAHPQTIAVVETRAKPIGLDTVVTDPMTADLEGAFGVMIQYPGTTGAIVDLQPIIERAHAAGALVVVAADPLALTVLTPPGELGADVVVGSTQRFGVPMGFGGPHAAYFA